jgi:hypothetical protein
MPIKATLEVAVVIVLKMCIQFFVGCVINLRQYPFILTHVHEILYKISTQRLPLLQKIDHCGREGGGAVAGDVIQWSVTVSESIVGSGQHRKTLRLDHQSKGWDQERCSLKLLTIKDHLHWQCLLVKPSAIATLDCTCLGHLGQCNTDRIISIWVVLPKVAKASK